jgi:hypothetical protein
MVKELLREQQDLKEQLKLQEKSKSTSMPGKINSKKASERVPRPAPSGGKSLYPKAGPSSRDK